MPSPFVSIIMPVRNEAEYIERSLGSILSQDYPYELMEVLVANGMSTDKTVERIREIGESSKVAVTVLENPGQSNHDLRVTAFLSYMAEHYPNAKLVGRQATNQDSNAAFPRLLGGESGLEIRRGQARIGERRLLGERGASERVAEMVMTLARSGR